MPRVRVVPTDRQKTRAPVVAPVDTSGMDPDMISTIQGEQQRRANVKSLFAPFAALFSKKPAVAVKPVVKMKGK